MCRITQVRFFPRIRDINVESTINEFCENAIIRKGFNIEEIRIDKHLNVHRDIEEYNILIIYTV